jgi:uncharacterized protein DUF6152
MKVTSPRRQLAARRGLGVAAALVLLCGIPASAHHSFTMFDNSRTITLTGTVKDFQWTNPHTWTWIDVPNDHGGTDQWGLEGMSPNYLGRRGWTKHTLKPGDKITVTIFPLKDGSKGGTFLRCKLPDGTEMVMFNATPSNAPLVVPQ